MVYAWLCGGTPSEHQRSSIRTWVRTCAGTPGGLGGKKPTSPCQLGRPTPTAASAVSAVVLFMALLPAHCAVSLGREKLSRWDA